MGAYPPSPSCDHLNFVKHAFMHGTYRITGDMEVWCEYQVGRETVPSLGNKSKKKVLVAA